ncbi:MAG TPA: ABC transporter ATP-binding protein [Puia sp.]
MVVAIKAEKVSKAYQLGQLGTGTISRDIERWFAKMRGKEDPFLKIGEMNDRTIIGKSDIVWSLKDIDFEIQRGDAVGIIGRNGAGKSTLLKILSRVTGPTLGAVKVKGRIACLLEVGTGFHPELTGKENIYLNGAILGMRKKEIDRKLDEIIDFSGVERYVDTPVKRYSSGMYVRLAFAVAAHLESEILIVDEVLAVGDSEFQKKCLGKMNNVSKQDGRTVLFVSHNMDAIKSLCNNGIFLQNGGLQYIGDVNSCCDLYARQVADSDKTVSSRDNIVLNNEVTLEHFSFDRDEYLPDQKVSVTLNLKSSSANSIDGCAILIYNEFDTRVGIIDLRKLDITEISGRSQDIGIKIEIGSLPLVDGIYKIGVWVHSKLCSENFLDLLRIRVQSELNPNILKYPTSVLGIINPDFNGKISEI